MPYEKVILFILVSVLVIACAYYSTYFLAKRAGKMKSGRSIKLRDRFSISKDKSICLIEVKQKVYLVAMTNQNVTLLDTLDVGEFDSAQASQQRKTEPQKYEPQGLIQKGLWSAFSAVKNNIRTDGKQGSAASGNPSAPVRDPEQDDLDLVFRRIQNRRYNSGSSEDPFEEESFK